MYAALHDGAEPVLATFRTAPRGRAKFTFTSFGDQGTPTLGKRYVPPAGVSNIAVITSGNFHSLAIKNDGTVTGWGYNAYGQATSPPGLTNVVAVAAGAFHNLALKNDGTVVAWGYIDEMDQVDKDRVMADFKSKVDASTAPERGAL